MHSYSLPFLLLLLTSALARPALNGTAPHLAAISRSDKCPVMLPEDPPASRIANGDPTAVSLARSTVALFISRDQYKCTGTLLSSEWVLTAAHCDISSSSFALFGARRTSEATDDNLIRVSKFIPHPRYTSGSRDYDIGIVMLESAAPADMMPVKVNVNPSLPKVESFVRVLGFGRTSQQGSSDETGLLRQVDVPVNSNSDCGNSYPEIDLNVQMCAGYYDKGGCDSCSGDSGGPMIQYNDATEPVLVGIVSVGFECAKPKFPGVYTRVAAFSEWIEAEGALFDKTTSTKAVFKSSLSTGVIVGIAVSAAVAVLVVIAFIVVFCMKRRNRKARKMASADTPPQTPSTSAAPGASNNSVPPPAPNTNFVPPPDVPPSAYSGASGPVTPQWTGGAMRTSFPGSHESASPPHSSHLFPGPQGFPGAPAPPPPPPQVPQSQTQGPMIPQQQDQEQYYGAYDQRTAQQPGYGQADVSGSGAPTAPWPSPGPSVERWEGGN